MYLVSFRYKKINYSVIFLFENTEYDFDTEIKNHLDNNFLPDKLLIFLPNKTYSAKYLALNRFKKAKGFTVDVFTFNSILEFYSSNNDQIDIKLWQHIQTIVFEDIFSRHECVLTANNHSYFKLPNNKYSINFIRVGNAFVCSHEMNTLSYFIAPLLINKPEKILCDTPSIFPIIYSTIHLLNSITKAGYSPIIKSFKSHSFNDDDFSRHDLTNTYIVISTTVSGSLPKRLNDRGVNWSNICVIYNFFKEDNKQFKSLSDFSRTEKYVETIQEFDSAELAKNYPTRTFKIDFRSDHFLPTAPKISSFILKKEHEPKWLNEFLQKYYEYSSDFISCYHGTNSKNKTRDLYFDIRAVLKSLTGNNTFFERKSNKLLVNNLPINITKVIYVDFAESKYMAELVASYYKNSHSREVEICYIDSFNIDEAYQDQNNFLVCVSCISEGKKVSEVSRLLRHFDKSQILYFCGIIRCFDETALKTLRGNLKLGRYGFNTYQLTVIEEIFLPNEDSRTLSWELEKQLLNEELGLNLLDYDLDENTHQFFEQRLTDLVSGKLVNNVFLNGIGDKPLKLNKNFAFFDFYEWEPTDIKQSLVYFTILAVFHEYRISTQQHQSVYERNLLDPENFNRYNDGIIQGALIRSANNFELMYSIDEQMSTKMLEIIKHSIKLEKDEDHNPLEFLIAICTKRMTLCLSDLEELVKLEKTSPHVKFLLQIIKHRILKTE